MGRALETPRFLALHMLQSSLDTGGINSYSHLFVSLKNPFPDRTSGQARHGGGLFWACGLHPGDARRVAVDVANLSDFAAAQEFESHADFTTDSRSAARFNSRDHQRAHPADNVFRSLRGAGAAGTVLYEVWGSPVCQPNLL